MQTWSFPGAARVLHASAWQGAGEGDEGGARDEGGGRGDGGGRVGTRGEGVHVGAGRSSDDGWCRLVGPCSCP